MIVIIDNYDSFTYNLYQYFGELDPNIAVFRNDEITIQELEKLPLSHIVLSSGAGSPENAGVSGQVIATFAGKVPILGIGLGHLVIAKHYGAQIVPAKRIAHGKSMSFKHQGEQIFHGVKNPLKVTCYHSLIVEPESIPDELKVLAINNEAEIMAIRHQQDLVFGLQFHPEAIATECGKQVLHNFLNQELLGGGSCVA